MLEGKATVKETDMSEKMQMHAMASASQALDLFDVSDSLSLASHIKKVRYVGCYSITIHLNFSSMFFNSN